MVSNFLLSCMLAACATVVDTHLGQHATAPPSILAPEGGPSAVQATVPQREPNMADLSYGNSTLELAAVRAPGGTGVQTRRRRRSRQPDSPWGEFLKMAILIACVACVALVLWFTTLRHW
mmetsp:Transcript_55175/g.106448  ORF Transcript_55175/g.106448 Transcript_55175/m.106448 type:complete len:120 (-) Transcript_55175:9-368(-)